MHFEKIAEFDILIYKSRCFYLAYAELVKPFDRIFISSLKRLREPTGILRDNK